jgi:1-acyl-sn-glycerol-3-phosphate acyltransferase
MLDLARLKSLSLSKRPMGQVVMAQILAADYRFPRRTEIILEGLENIPEGRPVYFAMNHTDRYNYWPFQYDMYRRGLPFTATWVKGKYYENGLMAKFFDSTDNIPLPSRGYVISSEFLRFVKRAPNGDEYRRLRDLVDLKTGELADASDDLHRFVRHFGGSDDIAEFRARFDTHFDAMMGEVTRLNRRACFELGLNVLVFPEGTRSVRLRKGLTGLVQMTEHLGVAIVPVGCNGSDKVYPGNSPFAKGGRIVYRIGKPLEVDGPELGPHRVRDAYMPFTRSASDRFGAQFESLTAVVMQHINALLDPEYQAGDEVEAKEKGVGRFL